MERWRSVAAMEIQTAPLLISHQHARSEDLSKFNCSLHLSCRGGSGYKDLARKQNSYVTICCAFQQASSYNLLYSSCLHLQVQYASGRVRLNFSTNSFVQSLILVNIKHGNTFSNPIKAKSKSGTAAKLEPKQKIRNKGKGRGKEQEKSIGRSDYQTESSKLQKDRIFFENRDDEGSVQGFAALAALKAQLLHNSTTSESLPKYSHLESHVQGRTTSNQEDFKLPSPTNLRNSLISLPQEVSTKLPRKVSDSDMKRKPLPESTSDERVSSEAKIQIYLSNLPTQLTTKEFNTIMQSVPGLSSWKLMVNQTGSCRGYGFCELNPHSDGEMAIELLSRMSIHGKPIFAKFSGISRPNYAQQSVKYNNSILTSDLLNPSNSSKEQVQTCTTESQMATRAQRLMEEKGPSGVGRALSKEVYIVDQTSKVPPQALQHLEKQTGNGCSSMGESILEAIKKATIERSKSSRRSKKASRRERKIIDDESRRDFHHHVGKVQPITIKPEWASELKCLEASLAALKKVL